jgi:hypothetical protein
MDPLTAEHVVAVAKAILDAADYCFLITQGEAGDASARLMQHFKPEGDLTLWFGTSAASRTVREFGSTRGSWSAGSRAGRRVCTPPGRRTTWRSKIGLVWTAAPTG